MVVKSDMENEEYEKLLNQYDYKFKKGDFVNGIVCDYNSEGVLIDIGAKTTAVCPVREVVPDDSTKVEEVLPKGSTHEFTIIRDEDKEDGKFLLSYKRVAIGYVWKDLESIKEQEQITEGIIKNIVKGGMLVDVAGVKGFVPSSQIQPKNLGLKIGDAVQLKILTIDSQNNSLILTNKLQNDTKEVDKDKLLSELEVGKVVEGEVVRLTDFGAFIDLGGVDGLLPLSQIAWHWVEFPSDVLKIGDMIKVEVISVDLIKHRVSLSLKNLLEDPWTLAKEQINDGDILKGFVTRIKKFGAFVEIFKCVEALLPQKEVLDYKNKTGKEISVGDKIDIVVCRFNSQDRRINLEIAYDTEGKTVKELI